MESLPAGHAHGHGGNHPMIEKIVAKVLFAKQLPAPNETSAKSAAANANGDEGGFTPLSTRTFLTI